MFIEQLINFQWSRFVIVPCVQCTVNVSGNTNVFEHFQLVCLECTLPLMSTPEGARNDLPQRGRTNSLLSPH